MKDFLGDIELAGKTSILVGEENQGETGDSKSKKVGYDAADIILRESGNSQAGAENQSASDEKSSQSVPQTVRIVNKNLDFIKHEPTDTSANLFSSISIGGDGNAYFEGYGKLEIPDFFLAVLKELVGRYANLNKKLSNGLEDMIEQACKNAESIQFVASQLVMLENLLTDEQKAIPDVEKVLNTNFLVNCNPDLLHPLSPVPENLESVIPDWVYNAVETFDSKDITSQRFDDAWQFLVECVHDKKLPLGLTLSLVYSIGRLLDSEKRGIPKEVCSIAKIVLKENKEFYEKTYNLGNTGYTEFDKMYVEVAEML